MKKNVEFGVKYQQGFHDITLLLVVVAMSIVLRLDKHDKIQNTGIGRSHIKAQ